MVKSRNNSRYKSINNLIFKFKKVRRRYVTYTKDLCINDDVLYLLIFIIIYILAINKYSHIKNPIDTKEYHLDSIMQLLF